MRQDIHAPLEFLCIVFIRMWAKDMTFVEMQLVGLFVSFFFQIVFMFVVSISGSIGFMMVILEDLRV